MTVAALLEARGLAGKRVAVENATARSSRKASTRRSPSQTGDRIEIVVAVGGG